MPSTGALLVLGMHRSGTSYVGGLAGLAGFDRLKGRDPVGGRSNPHGHQEVQALTVANEQLLNHMGAAWSAPPPFHKPIPFDRIPRRAAASARAALDHALVPSSWFWKDPRLALTADFWWPQIEMHATPLVMLVWRHPSEVARSLANRNSFPIPLGLALWESYTRHGLRHLATRGGLVLGYDAALREPTEIIRHLRDEAAGVGIELGPPPDPSAVEAWVDRGARHHEVDEREAMAELSVNQVALLDFLRSLPRIAPRFSLDQLPPATPWAVALLGARRKAERYRRELHRRDRWRPAVALRLGRQAVRRGRPRAEGRPEREVRRQPAS